MLNHLVLICVFVAGTLPAMSQDDPIVEIDSYMLAMDEVITREEQLKDCVWFGNDLNQARAKVKELGADFPSNMKFIGETLFLVVVTDRLDQAFDDVFGIARRQIIVIDLKERRKDDGDQSPASRPNAKVSRLLVIACSPLPWAKAFELRTGDGERHAIQAKPLEPNSPTPEPPSRATR